MSQNTHEELWKQIDGYPNYQVSNKGRVKNIKTGRVIKHGIDGAGYAFVLLYKANSKPKNYTVHRLVAQAFIPNPDNLPQVDHIDEDKLNNDVSNLRWVSASQNIRHSAHQKSCRINQLTLDGEFVKVWNSSRQIERETGYSPGHIIKCCKVKRKQAYGYKWEYADPEQQRKVNRSVAALTKDGEFVTEYKSAAEASRCLNICVQSIHYCLNGTLKTTHDLRFIYIDD